MVPSVISVPSERSRRSASKIEQTMAVSTSSAQSHYSNQVNNLKMRFLNINLNHSESATTNLFQCASRENIDLIAIQEPCLGIEVDNTLKRFPNRVSASDNLRPRAMIAINSRRVFAIALTQFIERDIAVARVNCGQYSMIFASVYCWKGHYAHLQDINPMLLKLRKLVDYAANEPLIIASDTNSRSYLWGDKTNDKRGNDLADWLLFHDLQILNMNGITTFAQIADPNKSSVIDLVIANQSALRHSSNA